MPSQPSLPDRNRQLRMTAGACRSRRQSSGVRLHAGLDGQIGHLHSQARIVRLNLDGGLAIHLIRIGYAIAFQVEQAGAFMQGKDATRVQAGVDEVFLHAGADGEAWRNGLLVGLVGFLVPGRDGLGIQRG